MTTSAQQRKIWIISLGAGFLILFLGFAALNAFNSKFLNPETTEQIVLYTAISAIAFLLFVGVLLMLVRNVLKLYADQKSRVMGSRLRTRMLWGAVLVSLLPIVFMYSFSYLLMNRAVDRWFSQPVAQMHDDSNKLAISLSQYTTANARVEAEAIGSAMPSLALEKNGPNSLGTLVNREAVQRVLREHEITLQGGFAVIYRDSRAVAALNVPQRAGKSTSVKRWLPSQTSASASEPTAEQEIQSEPVEPIEPIDPSDPVDAAAIDAARQPDSPILTLAGEDYALGLATLARPGEPVENIVVGLPLPQGMSATLARLRTAADNYYFLQRGRRSYRNTYMLLLLMMTGLALFASTWLALHLSKQVTKPVEALADAMALIAAGNYSHRVQESATEELGDLVRSFNHMAQDLEGSRAQVEASTNLLSAANAALETRRRELETMLETIPNGVATLDGRGRIVLVNRALSEMLDPGGQLSFIGQQMASVFPPELADSLDRLMRRSHRMGSAAAELEMSTDTPAGPLNLLATVALLERAAAGGMREHLGYVIVLENATELLRAQKQSAWKEVARRVAHEIKNPLTPIALSAEQIERHIGRLDSTLTNAQLQSPSVAVIRRCAEVISTSVDTMRSLVDQFASLAQFPTARPRPADLNTIVENSLALFAGRTQGIRIVRRLAKDLPLVLADPEAMKRALGNLVDNAVEAMQGSLLRELRIHTSLLDSGMIELVIADTGTGLTDEMRERLFLPYFSTKQRGTGLGLAIAAKIIQEHGGTIRAEKNEPAGAKFILELRPANSAEGDTSILEPASESLTTYN
jgi:two-component system nitrogen regulation sensor histidine kinase NtrY